VEAGTLSVLRSSRLLAAGTGVRILLAPVVMALVLSGSDTAAAAVFFVAAATDWIDGRLARRWGVTTRLGAFLDTTATSCSSPRRWSRSWPSTAPRRGSRWSSSAASSRSSGCGRGRLGRRAPRDLDARQVEGDDPVRGPDDRMLRPDVTIAGAYLDEWGLVFAAVVTAWSGVDYLLKFSASLRSIS
jgi:CDP-diacylglycerol--glycerol-3-phosphate 3-phosphatidyltransferase